MGVAENGGVACKCMREKSLKFNSSSLSGGGGVFRYWEKRKFRKNLVNVFQIPLLRWELSSSRSVASSNRILSLDAREKSRSRLFALSKHKRVPIFVMMPIDSFCTDTSGDMKIRKIKALTVSLKALKLAGVYGIAVEVWWGIVERTSPFAYNWSLYEELFKLISDSGLKLHIALSFHSNMHLSSAVQGRVSLPLWIVEIGRHNKDIYYQDQNGLSNDDYLTLGVDQHPLFCGRTALQCYEDFMSNFVNKFEALIGTLIEEVSVGLGPCGELRYPAHPFGDGRWRFPGIGEFQCYDKYMMEDLKKAAYQEGKPQWGNTGPQNAGYYNSFPSEVPFFEEGHDSFLSDYGRFFLEWYSSKLIRHADVILAKAASILEKYQENEQNTLLLVAKIGIIYWWYQTVSHPAELTAGYYNTAVRDGYDPLASVLSRHGAALQISCFEIRDTETPETYLCSPERLLQQIRTVSKKKIIHLTGRNSYERFDKTCIFSCRLDYSRYIPTVTIHKKKL
ncbi:inactive beta-amylase 4, chloroplastic isoform X3 [Rhododendron vialii]|uniref:inactive beta-amylase 4, chloroplastic isoform X3 n=1 Tax=Rhododendron vialii TaxID=182163 RepID=UPI00265E5CC8|nr:inactive beta-amylase 4, chloroplastic isoform X3 [Rhododendron vialii]